jgi:hypothetical protein
MNRRIATLGAALVLAAAATPGLGAEAGTGSQTAADVLSPVSQRFSQEDVREVPDFQRHILPLMGRLGCNGRACHGSFQGQGGFRLSLFGYDFKMDHEALLKPDSKRVDTELPEGSKILQKPTLTMPHKGGKRLDEGSWQYEMLVRWIEAGAKGVSNPVKFERLDVTPTEIVFERPGQQVPLKVIAHWADGTREDVTCITRFRTNDESIAEIDADGVVTSKGKGDTHVVAFYDNGVAVTQAILPVSDKVGPQYPDVPTPTKVDELVVEKLRKLGIVPSEVCSDTEFLRRLSLDMTGSLPTPAEVEAFLSDPSPSKRERKIDELLTRPTYAAWWSTKLCDITGVSQRAFQNMPAPGPMARDWYQWIYRRVEQNMPYDTLVEKIVLASSRQPGQSYDDYVKEQSSYYRPKDPADFSKRETMPYYWAKRTAMKPEEKALNFSYTFLGVRLECAQCHKHPFDQWTQDDFNQFTAFFNNVRFGQKPDSRARMLEMQKELGVSQAKGNVMGQFRTLLQEGKVVPWQEVFVVQAGQRVPARKKQASALPKTGRVVSPKVLGGDEVATGTEDDPRKPLMDWLRSKDNPYFARAFVNRVWATYFGSGIINPPDDMNLANPPSNAALLDYLADGFIEHGFDMKWLHREIAMSQTYQLAFQSNETNRLDERNYSRAVVRRLPAEVLIDAVAQATGSSTYLASASTDMESRAIGPKAALGVDNRGNNQNGYATKVFGGSPRDTNCDCNRSNEPNLLQSIFMQNDQDLLNSLERGTGWVTEMTKTRNGGKHDPDQTVRDAYLRSLSRPPTDREARVASDYLQGASDERQALRDLLWALLNTKEFITNH